MTGYLLRKLKYLINLTSTYNKNVAKDSSPRFVVIKHFDYNEHTYYKNEVHFYPDFILFYFFHPDFKTSVVSKLPFPISFPFNTKSRKVQHGPESRKLYSFCRNHILSKSNIREGN